MLNSKLCIKFIFSVLIIGLIILFINSCAPAPQEVTIFIGATGDEHGELFDYNFISQETQAGGLVRVSSWVKEFRNSHDEELIMLSAGDIIQGTVLTSLHNSCYDKEPDPMIIAMNYIDYKASALGNHDIEQGLPVLKELKKQMDFPILAANAIEEGTENEPYFQPYQILKTESGAKIAVIGMITPGIPRWLNKSVYAGIEFKGIPESMKYWIKKVKEEERPDILIGLLHSGYGKKEKGEKKEEGLLENAARETALANPELDLIISGHIHIPVEKAIENGVLITQPGSGGKNVSLITLKLKESREGDWEIVNKDSRLISMESYQADPELSKKVSEYFKRTKEFATEPIAEIGETVNTYFAYFRDNPIIDLIHRVQLEKTNADISFAASFNPNLIIKKGKVRVADIAGIYKYENFLYVRELTGKMIKDYLEYCATFYNGTEKFDEGIVSGNLKGYNYDTLEGLNYVIDLSKPEGERIVSLIDPKTGKAVEPKKVFRVAMNNYRSNGGGDHLKASDALDTPITYKSSKPVRQLIIEYLQGDGKFKTEPTGNWRLKQEKEVIKRAKNELENVKEMR